MIVTSLEGSRYRTKNWLSLASSFGIIDEIMYGCSEAVIKRDPDETPYFAGG
jgi:hypothetical protein